MKYLGRYGRLGILTYKNRIRIFRLLSPSLCKCETFFNSNLIMEVDSELYLRLTIELQQANNQNNSRSLWFGSCIEISCMSFSCEGNFRKISNLHFLLSTKKLSWYQVGCEQISKLASFYNKVWYRFQTYLQQVFLKTFGHKDCKYRALFGYHRFLKRI